MNIRQGEGIQTFAARVSLLAGQIYKGSDAAVGKKLALDKVKDNLATEYLGLINVDKFGEMSDLLKAVTGVEKQVQRMKSSKHDKETDEVTSKLKKLDLANAVQIPQGGNANGGMNYTPLQGGNRSYGSPMRPSRGAYNGQFGEAGQRCFNCNELGHHQFNCPNNRPYAEQRCYNCNEPGHFQSQCPRMQGGAGMGSAQAWRNSCSKCGGKNHMEAVCIQCRFCKWWGHSENQCPNRGSGGGNGGNGTNSRRFDNQNMGMQRGGPGMNRGYQQTGQRGPNIPFNRGRSTEEAETSQTP